MKIDTLRSGGQSQGGLDASGGTLSGPLMLSRDPQVPLEAATKRYIDNGVQALNASNIVAGTLPITRLPAFSGDVTSEAGQNTMNLSNTGVTAGEYGKVVVDAKGRVTNGTGVGNTDIPNISFDKITTGKPTTLAGYGITDAISVSGGLLTGELILSSNPGSGEHMVPKQYVDGMTNSLSAAKTGDIVRKAYSTTPTGFLKCNGAEVSKTTYSDLYAILGDSNTNYNIVGSGEPWKQQYEFNNIPTGDLGSWTAGTNLPSNAGWSNLIVTKNRVYLIGGYNGSAYTSTVYTAPINSDGTLGAWSTGTAFPLAIGVSQAIITKNRVYLLGGYGLSGHLNTIYSAVINSDGTIGTWENNGTLPVNISGHQIFVTKNRVYILGGYNNTGYLNSVYTATLNADGTIGAWSTGTSLPVQVCYFKHAIIKNRVYIFGGETTGGTVLSTIYTAPINPDGTLGTWSTYSISMPGPVKYQQIFVTKNTLYMIGGNSSGSTVISTVYACVINPDGTLGTWTTVSALPTTINVSQIFATKSKVYLIGGANGVVYLQSVYYVSVNGGKNDYSVYYEDTTNNYLMPGSGQPWRQQYQINNSQSTDITGWASGTALPASVGVSQAVVTKNRVYLLGGDIGNNVISTVYTAPINTDGTLGTWVTTNSLPAPVSRSQAVVTKNRVYLIGSYNGSAYTANVYTAPINADGTLGSWTSGTSLPGANCVSQIIVTRNRLYVLGGSNNGTSALSTVYWTTIGNDGTLGSWNTGDSLPVTIGYSISVVTKNRVYLLGGWNGGIISTIYTAVINIDGSLGVWSSAGTLPTGSHWSCGFVSKNRVYMIGGHNGSSGFANVYHAPILPDGTLGSWVTGTSLPFNLYGTSLIATNNRIYMLGGVNSGSHTSTVFTAVISEGSNDYSQYYDGTVLPLEAVDPTTTFKLPDMSSTDINGIYHYIKY
jgi:hypothetical protein